MDNCYLLITVSLLAFFAIVLLYIKYFYQSFTPLTSGIPAVEAATSENMVRPLLEKDTHLYDTRYKYPYLPPVNPMVEESVIYNSLPANDDLYKEGNYETKYNILNQPANGITNQLDYSGGKTQMISIPLQKNYPYNESLRSNDILITPYNVNKYGTTPCSG